MLEHEKGEVITAAICREPQTGRTLTVLTDQPGIQMYTAPELSGEHGKDGVIYGPSSAVCFETQNFPKVLDIHPFLNLSYSA